MCGSAVAELCQGISATMELRPGPRQTGQDSHRGQTLDRPEPTVVPLRYAASRRSVVGWASAVAAWLGHLMTTHSARCFVPAAPSRPLRAARHTHSDVAFHRGQGMLMACPSGANCGMSEIPSDPRQLAQRPASSACGDVCAGHDDGKPMGETMEIHHSLEVNVVLGTSVLPIG
jgi:hypothetical protein